MKTVSLKRTTDDLAEYAAIPMEQYGYGLRIYLDGEACEKLGIDKAVRAGAAVTLQAKAIVCESTERLEAGGDSGGKDICLSLQITDMGLAIGGVMRNAAAELYGDGS